MADQRIFILGKPIVEGQSGRVAPSATKPLALLWYLAAQPDRDFTRSHLAALLWEQHPEADGRQSLSSALRRLRQALPFWPLRLRGDMIGWEAAGSVSVDASDFLDAMLREDWSEAAALWRGPFLDGVVVDDFPLFDDWLAATRQAWCARATKVFDMLIREREASGDLDGVITQARRALAVNPLQEHFHQALMSALYQAGDRAAALSHYRECERLLDEELGVAPDPATAQLRQTILAGDPLLPRLSCARGAVPIAALPVGRAERLLPLSGRKAELGRLERWLDHATRSRGTSLLLCGEMGIGKSRLLAEGLRLGGGSERYPQRFATVLETDCHEESSSFPLEPLRSLQLAKPYGRPPEYYQLDRLLSHLAAGRLSGPGTVAGHLESDLFHRLCETLGGLPGPVLLIVEDMHWADLPTVRLLTYLMHQRFPRGFGLLMTVQPDRLSPVARGMLESLGHEGVLERLELGRLNLADTAALVAAWRGEPDPTLAASLFAETGGNPFYTLAFLRDLPYRCGGLGAELPLPPELSSLLCQRLAMLSQPAADLVRAASIFSEPVAFALLEHLTGQSEEAILEALDSAIDAGILHEVDTDSHITFVDPLFRRAVVNSLSASRRRTLNRRCLTFPEGASSGELRQTRPTPS